ncbi:MAG: alpha/beta hydrolase [Chthoniobacterales bacterium]
MSETKQRAGWGRRVVDWLIFVAIFLWFLCSLLVLTSAPTSLLWVVAILVTEWGHYAGCIALLLAVLSWRRGSLGRAMSVLALVSAALCFSPAIRAAGINRSLPQRITAAFGSLQSVNGRARPFSALDLFLGVPTSGVEVTEHVYTQRGSTPLKLDLYRSREIVAPQPIVIMIHGGAWRTGSKAELPALNRYLAQQHYAVASIDYRLAPESRSPAAVDDAFQAIDYLKTNAAALRLDPTRMVLIGRSAGGQIALAVAYAGREPAIRGVVGFYSPSDLVLGYEKPSRRWVIDSCKVLRDYLGGTPIEKPDAYAVASPINFVNANTPPTLLIHGQLDPLVWPEQSERLAARLKENGRPYFHLYIPWGTHGCDANLNGPSGQLSVYAIDRFLAYAFHAPL